MSLTAERHAPRPSRYTEAEWAARVELAACYRLIDHFGLTDLVFNHITARVPDAPAGEELLLINGFGLHYSEISASNLIKIDVEGNALEETGYPVNRAGYVIHSAIHEARPDLRCIIHTHSRAGCAISALKEGLIPLDQQSFMFHERVAYHDLEGIAVDADEKSRLVRDLGDKNFLILRNHGLLTTGRSVAEAFRGIYYLERACQLQMDVLATGREINPPPPGVAEHVARQVETGAAGQGSVDTIEWPALVRLMERKDPSFMS